MPPIYMVIGCPGSGKSWVCEQLAEQFHYVRHDSSIGGDYLAEIKRQAKLATKPLLIETPFSVSQIKDPLEKAGFDIVPVFIQERDDVIRERYLARQGYEIPEGHLSRQTTYAERAKLWGSYCGTSVRVLAYLRNATPAARKQFPWD